MQLATLLMRLMELVGASRAQHVCECAHKIGKIIRRNPSGALSGDVGWTLVPQRKKFEAGCKRCDIISAP